MHTVSRRPLVILTEYLDQEAITWLSDRVELVECAVDDSRFPELLARASGLVIRTYTIIDQAFLDQAPELKVVGRAGVGLDNVDLEACRSRGIEVVNTPDANRQAVVEYVTAFMTDSLRPRVPLQHAVDAGQWGELRKAAIVEKQMNEMTLGILGLGKIGSRIAEVGRAIGFSVIYNDLEDRSSEAESVDLETLFKRSDVLTVHVDGRPENHGLLQGDHLNLMKPGVLFLNTSRGFVVDQSALADFLNEHSAARAILDVHETEPVPADNPLLDCANAGLYPHLASRTMKAQANMSWVVRDVARVLGV